ncbi:MAG: DUF4091 domain-containing protein [Ruminococcaceae bacterium]|nr:DUF4091 domain-containing protein [Oscillospiraceae bacterium]
MKRFVSVILILVTVLALFACEKGGDNGSETTKKPGITTDGKNDPDTTTKKPSTTKPSTTDPSTTKPSTTKPSTTTKPTTTPPVTEAPIKGKLEKFNLKIGTTVSGSYRFAAYDVANDKMCELEPAKRATWSADYPGHHILYEPYTYVIQKSEGKAIVDLMCTEEYGATVVYTATSSGSATAVCKLSKLWANGSKIDAILMSGNGTVLAEERGVTAKTSFTLKGTADLLRGETVFLIVKYSDDNKTVGGQNVCLESFAVYFDEHNVSTSTVKPTVYNDSITSWATHSYDKIILNAPQNTYTTNYTVNMAKAETEGCQLVVMNSASSGVKNGRLVLLSKPLPSIQTDIYVLDNYEIWEGYHYTDACSPYDGENVSIAAKTPLPFLVEFTTTGSTPAGDYEYLYAFVNNQGKTVATFTVTVHVWNFAIPTEKNFRTAAGLDMWLACVFEEVDDQDHAAFLELYRTYHEFLLKHNLVTYNFPADIRYDNADMYMSSPLITFIEVPCIDGTKEEKTLLPDEVILEYYKKLKKNPTWLKKAVFYPFDEPHTIEQIAKYNEMCEHLRKLCPEIPVIAPFYTNLQTGTRTDQVDAMYGDSGIWCPKLGLWDHSESYDPYLNYTPSKSFADRMAEKVKNGTELWSYVCNAPNEPYSQLFVNTKGGKQRMLFWQFYQRDVSGFLYWGTNKWSSISDYENYISPWDTLNIGLKDDKGRPIVGEGSIFYPGKPVGLDEPVASIRLKIVRDGIDDIELMYLAEKYLGESWVMNKTYSATSNLTSFTDNDSFAQIRKEIGDALEKKINK